MPTLLSYCTQHVCVNCAETDRSLKIAELRGNHKRIKCILCREHFHSQKETPWKVNVPFIQTLNLDVDLSQVRTVQAAKQGAPSNALHASAGESAPPSPPRAVASPNGVGVATFAAGRGTNAPEEAAAVRVSQRLIHRQSEENEQRRVQECHGLELVEENGELDDNGNGLGLGSENRAHNEHENSHTSDDNVIDRDGAQIEIEDGNYNAQGDHLGEVNENEVQSEHGNINNLNENAELRDCSAGEQIQIRNANTDRRDREPSSGDGTDTSAPKRYRTMVCLSQDETTNTPSDILPADQQHVGRDEHATKWLHALSRDGMSFCKVRVFQADSKGPDDPFGRKCSFWCVKNGCIVCDAYMLTCLPERDQGDGNTCRGFIRGIHHKDLLELCKMCPTSQYYAKQRNKYTQIYRDFVTHPRAYT